MATEAAFQLKSSLASQHMTNAGYIYGGYIVVSKLHRSSASDFDALDALPVCYDPDDSSAPEKDGIIVSGSLVYVLENSKLYQCTAIDKTVPVAQKQTAATWTEVLSFNFDPSTKQNTLTFDLTPTDGSSNPVTSDGVYDALQDLRESLEGKSSSYVVSDRTNPVFDSTDNTITLTAAVTDISGATVNLSDLKIGAIFYVTETDVPDRWVGLINKTGATVTSVVLYKFETDLSGYVKLADAQTITGSKTFTADTYHQADIILNNGEYLQGKDSNNTNTYNLIGIKSSSSEISLGSVTAGDIVSYDTFKPNTTGLDLGTSANKWTNLYLSGNLSDGTNTTTVESIVTKAGAQTISGTKTFSTAPILNNNIFLQGKNTSGTAYNLIGMNSGNSVIVGNSSAGLTLSTSSAVTPNANGTKNLGSASLTWNDIYLSGTLKDATHTFTLPSETGTLALTSDIPDPPQILRYV